MTNKIYFIPKDDFGHQWLRNNFDELSKRVEGLEKTVLPSDGTPCLVIDYGWDDKKMNRSEAPDLMKHLGLPESVRIHKDYATFH